MGNKTFADALSGLSADSRDLLLEQGRPVAMKKGGWLLREEQVCRSIFYIEEGLVRSFRSEDGRDTNLDFSFEGDFVTHLRSLRSGTGADYSLQALERIKVVELSESRLRALYHESAEIESFGRQLVEGKLMQQEAHAHFFRLHTPAERYQYVTDRHPEMLRRISLSNLASFLGISRETLSRIRGK